MNCLECGKELTGNQRKFCSRGHKSTWRNKNIYGYRYQKDYRGRSMRNYLSQLRSYHNRRETLSLDFLEELYNKQDGKCAITGIQMTHEQNSRRNPENLSIDRIDSSIGYTPENTQLVCYRVNLMKAEGSLSDLKDWCKKILND